MSALISMGLVQSLPAATTEDAAKDAVQDLTADKFYNRPGATRAEYEADWAACRLIARGTPPPSKNFPNVGEATVFLGILPAILTESIERRYSRNTCLLVRGWRQYSLGPEEKQRVQAMSEADRAAYFEQAIRAPAAPGTPYGRIDFAPPRDPALVTDGNPTLPGSVYIGRKIDPAVAMTPGANEGLVVLAFRRPGKGSSGRAIELQLQRYDRAKRDLAYPSAEATVPADSTTYAHLAESIDRNAAYEVQVLRLTQGDYVIAGTAISRILLVGVHTNANCFGAPLFHVDAGQTVYIGDFTPFFGVKLSSGGWGYGIGYSRHLEDARATLATKQPALAATMRQATMFNQARFTCVGGLMDRWDLPALEALPDGE
uniref:hypothetical protein n=1 Tax=Sphingomonas bacterium TaxID=1895847 RepID=UPI00261B40CA|nr:hypothetical protein [Sphingomonas bacterium]